MVQNMTNNRRAVHIWVFFPLRKHNLFDDLRSETKNNSIFGAGKESTIYQ